MLTKLLNFVQRSNDAYLEGYISYTGGKLLNQCPYSLGTKEHIEWTEGWWKGVKEDARDNN